MKDIVDRFISYTEVYTTSDPESDTTPTSERQKDLGKILVEELHEMGIENAFMDDKAYVYAGLDSNTDKDISPIGFISHMDTAPDMTGEGVNPQIIEYKGGDIVLSDSVVTRVEDFPFLKDLEGQTLITTDGSTLLGADDKAGIAIIMTAVEYLIENPQIKHGDIKIAFTPDEEVGKGAHLFDIDRFGADFAYTVDGGPEGELEYESFNAAEADIKIHGKSVHPGSAKDVMINSQLLGMELFSMLPVNQRPEYTENYEGFFMLMNFTGTVEETSMNFIIRDHDREKFEAKKNLLEEIVKFLNTKYGDLIDLEISDTYYNMREKIEPVYEIVELAKRSMEEIGVEPIISPIRGGTDGSILSFRGLPTPNLFTGGYAYHGKHELVSVDQMKKGVNLLAKIIENHAK
ncbi:MAG: peptidase T [Finegoldia sp.]|nr:peptidase T [Finegoldia sp.]